jgi:HEPN domain-containing protein
MESRQLAKRSKLLATRARRGIEVRRVDYYSAAEERLAFVRALREAGTGNTALAAYVSGLSVECALRALIPEDEDFMATHNFVQLAVLGAFRVADDVAYENLGRQLNELQALWRNSLRFYSHDRFEAHCRERAKSLNLNAPRKSKPSSAVCFRLYSVSQQSFLECARRG